MPRPKRTKVAPSAPAPRLRQPTTAKKNAISTTTKNDDIYDISDPDEVKTTSARRGQRSATKAKGKGKELTQDEDDAEHEVARPQADALDVGGEGLYDDIDLSSSIEMSRHEPNINTPASRLSLANFRRRPRQPSILGRGPGRGRSSSVESNLAQDNLMSVGRKGTSVLRGRQRATSISRHGVAPPSMALQTDSGRGMTPMRGTSLGLNLGNFKRREREPSILGTGKKRRDERREEEEAREDNEEDFEIDGESGFMPEGESTPLNFEKSKGGAESGSGIEVRTTSSKKRKRSLEDDDVLIPQSSENIATPSVSRGQARIAMTISSDHSSEDETSDNELPLPSIEAQDSELEAEPVSETMAPPMSSSSQSSSPRSPSLPPPRAARPVSSRGRQLRGRTPLPRTQDSPISSPPSLTHSPNRAGTRAVAKKPVAMPSTFSTAQLQALMPQRRRRARARNTGDPFDVPSSDHEAEIDTSGLAASDDELSHLNVRARPRRINALSTTKSKSSKPNRIPLKQVPKRNYGRSKVTAANTSDKENGEAEDEQEDEEMEEGDSLAPLPDSDPASENSQELEARVGRELKNAARKFREVDKWELDFEDVSASSESWRERDAR